MHFSRSQSTVRTSQNGRLDAANTFHVFAAFTEPLPYALATLVWAGETKGIQHALDELATFLRTYCCRTATSRKGKASKTPSTIAEGPRYSAACLKAPYMRSIPARGSHAYLCSLPHDERSARQKVFTGLHKRCSPIFFFLYFLGHTSGSHRHI